MSKSATRLGEEFGNKNGREMNQLLKKYGYIEGAPGAYGLTEKGSRFGKTYTRNNGHGGWAFRQWEETFWSDETAEALRADIEQYPEGIEGSTDEISDCSSAPECGGVSGYADYVDVDSEDVERERRLKIVLSAAALGFLFTAPLVKPFYTNKIKPTARKLQEKFRTTENIGQQEEDESLIPFSPENVEDE